MEQVQQEPLNLTKQEVAILFELLQAEYSKLMIEIRHTDHRRYREELRHRLTAVEGLRERCRAE